MKGFKENGLEWKLHHPRANRETLGFIPEWLDAADASPLSEQIDRNYKHGGGWHSCKKFWGEIDSEGTLHSPYEGDQPLPLIASVEHPNGQKLHFYPHAMVAVFDADGTFDLARID